MLCSVAHAQQLPELTPGYYVTVAAYAPSKADYARRYVETLQQKGVQATYGYNTSRELYFVYLEYFGDLKSAINRMLAVRQDGSFADAWVRVIPGYITGPPVAATGTQPADPGSTQSSGTAVAVTTEPAVVTATTTASQEPAAQETTPAETPADSTPAEEPEEKLIQHNPTTLGNTEVFFSLFNATNNRIIEGDVQVVDADNAKPIKKVKGNEYIMLPDTKNQSNNVLLIADVFGYRKIQHQINVKEPMKSEDASAIELMGTSFVVYFDLVRYRQGDIATLYNVYFYNDAAVMLPSSRYELNNLLQMMQENAGYRIRLHGHTNGNYHGKIITMGPEKNFFSMDGSRQSIGSAKDLSFQRASIIKEFLIANGIDANRVDVKAWGGKRPLYDKHGPNAKKNVRVEVEVLSE